MTTVDQADSGTFEAVVLLYLAASKLPDGDISTAEAVRIVELTRKHSKGLAAGYPEQVVRDASKAFVTAGGTEARLELVVNAANRLSEHLDPHSKLDLVEELQGIVEIDGEVTTQEREFVVAAAKTLGLSLS